ncbi:MAG: AEC family transporter [Anaerolineae bacterium]|nr:AEC family transporter [Anaerolineae bacterium]MDW8172745.1 AEC family transporter [Anaerolineae bacterium]
MLQLFSILLNVISPIFILIGLAYVVGKRLAPDPRALSVFLIYVFVPALSFNGLRNADLRGGAILGFVAVAVGLVLMMILIGLAIGAWLGGTPQRRGALVMTLFMVNGANYGTPVNTFAYGTVGGELAVLYYVVNSILSNFLGVFFASRGGSVGQAIRNALSVPVGYAALLGGAVNLLSVEMPLFLSRGIDIMAQAAIPCMLALLGLQLSHMTLNRRGLGLVLLVSGVRLIGGALAALPLCALFGLQGVAFQVAMTQSAMPTAVMTNALATEFGSDVEFTSAVTLISTLLSVVTLSVLIALLL